MNKTTRVSRAACTLLAAALLAVSATAALAAWPDKPIKILVPWPPGGATDQIGRMLSLPLSQALGTPVMRIAE